MHTKRAYSRLYQYIRATFAGLVATFVIIYAITGRPDYHAATTVARTFLPVAKYAGDIITWPVRISGRTATKIRQIVTLRAQNEELRAKLADAMLRANEFDIAQAEVHRLREIVGLRVRVPKNTIVAEIKFDGAALAHNTFFISKGTGSGVGVGMAVVNMQGQLVGQIIDTGSDFARARALRDSKSNIPVRIAGTNVYGFLTGNGTHNASLGFLSDPNFEITPDLDVVTSGIRGVLPDGLIVGRTRDKTDVAIANPVRDSAVLVLEFDGTQKYK